MLPLLSLLPLVAKAAPALISHFTGDEGKDKPLLEKVAYVAKDATGIDNLSDAVNALTGNAEAQNQFGLLLMDRKLEFERIQLESKKVDVEDTQGARTAQVERIKVGSKEYVQSILAMSAAFCFFAMVGYVIAFGLADMSKEAAFITGNITGLAGAIAKDVYHYYFGSSSGSKEKTKLITAKE
jgi:hypothetical protein